MSRAYRYIGPAELRELVSPEPDLYVRHIGAAADVLAWVKETGQVADAEKCVVATYIVDRAGRLWAGERRMEHVVVACGRPVLMAGEITFCLDGAPHVTWATNQSTGYCPQPSGWAALANALDGAGIEHPAELSRAFEFRRCEACGTLNLVKDDGLYCAVCDADLPKEWNVGNFKPGT
jgi:hypothetical protein